MLTSVRELCSLVILSSHRFRNLLDDVRNTDAVAEHWLPKVPRSLVELDMDMPLVALDKDSLRST